MTAKSHSKMSMAEMVKYKQVCQENLFATNGERCAHKAGIQPVYSTSHRGAFPLQIQVHLNWFTFSKLFMGYKKTLQFSGSVLVCPS